MPETYPAQPNNENDRSPNRRESLKLIAGLVALATGLGVPREVLGKDTPVRITVKDHVMIKFYRGKEDGGGLIETTDIPDKVVEYLASPAGARLQWKLYGRAAGELGSLQMPAQISIKVNRTETKSN